MFFLVVKPKISWIDKNSNDKNKLTTIIIPNYQDIDFNRLENSPESKALTVKSIIKVKIFVIFLLFFILLGL